MTRKRATAPSDSRGLDGGKGRESFKRLERVCVDGRDASEERRRDDENPRRRVGDAHRREEPRNGDRSDCEDDNENRRHRREDARKERLHLPPFAARGESGRLFHHGHRERENREGDERRERRDGKNRAYVFRRDVARHEPHAGGDAYEVPRPQGEKEKYRAPRKRRHQNS